MKKLLIAFLPVSSLCSAAIAGPFPIGIGVDPLPHTVARVNRIDITFFPQFALNVSVEQFVSLEMYAANQPFNAGGMGGVYMGSMSAADFATYVTGPMKAGTISNVAAGCEAWLARVGGPLAGWTVIP